MRLMMVIYSEMAVSFTCTLISCMVVHMYMMYSFVYNNNLFFFNNKYRQSE